MFVKVALPVISSNVFPSTSNSILPFKTAILSLVKSFVSFKFRYSILDLKSNLFISVDKSANPLNFILKLTSSIFKSPSNLLF